MSDLFGNHIVGFPTRRLIYCNDYGTVPVSLSHILLEYGLVLGEIQTKNQERTLQRVNKIAAEMLHIL